MSLTTKIGSIINALYPDATFILSSRFNANRKSHPLESTDLPLIVLDNTITKTAEIKQNNNVIKDTKVLITFLNKDDKYNNDSETDVIRQAMEAMADRVAVNIYQLEEVKPDGNQSYRLIPVFHAMNTDLSGVTLEMNIKENQLVNFCPT